MSKDSLIDNHLGIPSIQIGRNSLLVRSLAQPVRGLAAGSPGSNSSPAESGSSREKASARSTADGLEKFEDPPPRKR